MVSLFQSDMRSVYRLVTAAESMIVETEGKKVVSISVKYMSFLVGHSLDFLLDWLEIHDEFRSLTLINGKKNG